MYKYGMRLRPAMPGAQPRDFVKFTEPTEEKQTFKRHYWNILYYKRILTQEEMKAYDLDYLGEE